MSGKQGYGQLLEEAETLRRKVAGLEESRAELVYAEAQKRAILDGLQTNIAFVNKDLEILWVNKCAADSVAVAPSEMIGRKCHEFWADPDKPCEGCPSLKAFLTGKSEHVSMVTPDGRIWDEKGEPVFDSEGNVVGVIEIAQDVTATMKLQQERDRLFNLSLDMLAVIGFDGYLKQVNPAWSRTLGWSSEELLATPAIEWVHPEDREAAKQSLAELVQGGTVRCKFRCKCKDGSYRWISLSSYALPEEHLIFAVARDVTEDKQIEAALRRSESKYKLLFENAPVGILSIDSEGRILEVNQNVLDLMGSPSAEATKAINMFDYKPLVDAGMTELVKRSLLGEQVTKEIPYTSKWGKYTYFQVVATPIREADGHVTGCQAVMEDITARKQAEERQRLLATALEQADEVVVIADVHGRVQYVNPAFERISGYGVEDAISNPDLLLRNGENDAQFYENVWETAKNGEVWKGRLVNRRKNGDLYHEEATISPVRDTSGQIANFVVVKRDITENLDLSKQLLQAQKMEAIGTLAGGIAHDFNNLLQITLGYSELLLSEKSRDDPDCGDLERIHQAATSGAELVRRLLAFSLKLEPKPRPLDLNGQIIGLKQLLRRTIPRMIDIRQLLTDNLDRVNADPDQMEQMLMNLAINARDAMPERGILTIQTRVVTLDEEFCRHHVGSRPGKHVVVTVSDTGHGMDRQTVEHIFEPFFTTKQLGRGTGLGLAMVYGIVKQHNGYITCESRLGEGTDFSVYLPAIDSTAETEVVAKETKPASGAETILLVDDEELVRELGVRILTKAGYKVVAASNGREGLALFQSHRPEISLVILDLIMPELGGKQCLEDILSIDPQMKVLIASGHSPDSSIRACIDLGARGFVSKPFNIQKLLEEVRQILDTP